LLVEADYVAGGVAEPGSDLGGVGADGLDDFALVGEDGVEGGGHALAHDVEQKAGLGGGRASEDEGAADLAGGVVKGGAAIAAFADGPVEDLVVEVGGARDVGGGEFDVADFSVGGGGEHGCRGRRHFSRGGDVGQGCAGERTPAAKAGFSLRLRHG
jgi:hypothetical protein